MFDMASRFYGALVLIVRLALPIVAPSVGFWDPERQNMSHSCSYGALLLIARPASATVALSAIRSDPRCKN